MPVHTNSENMSFLSLMLPIWGLIAVFAITFVCRRKRWAMAIGPVLMFAVHFAAQNVTAKARRQHSAWSCPVRSRLGHPEGTVPGSVREPDPTRFAILNPGPVEVYA
jgi:hypothetical protein